MPRYARQLIDRGYYHVINRGNGKQTIYHDTQDYSYFLHSAVYAKNAIPIDIYSYCLMPNHYHFVVRPQRSSNLSRWIHRIMTKFNYYHQNRYTTVGHLWQGPFKDFLIEDEYHLVNVLKYVEANPMRAGLASASAEWRWSSLSERFSARHYLLSDHFPITLPEDWKDFVDSPFDEEIMEKLHKSLKCQKPFGNDEWVKSVCLDFGLRNRTRARGRPKKER